MTDAPTSDRPGSVEAGHDAGANRAVARHERRVRRYSARVQWAKILLPLAAFIMIGLVFLTGRGREAALDVGSAADMVALGAGLRLDNPRFAGVTEDGQPFIVTAAWALPDGAVPDRVALEAPKGELEVRQGQTLVMTSRKGELRRKTEHLDMNGNVVLQSSDGYRATTDRVAFDLAAKSATVPGVVQGSGPLGDLRADGMRILRANPKERALTIFFEGNVRLTYRPKRSADR